jgi:hypothetical protein
MPEEIVQAVCNLHTQHHVKQCFKCDDECRHDLPQPQTQVEAEGVSWLSWKGEKSVIDILRIDPVRGEHDVCVNACCQAISKSKLACNSNFRFLFGGSDAFHTAKHSTKDTQKEDTEGFDEVVALTRKRVIKQVFESPFSETMSRLIGATVVHNSKNVTSAPMASYLSRNNSRFKMSHTSCFVPLRDIKEHLDGKELTKTIGVGCKLNCFEATSLDHLHRPKELEKVSLFNFMQRYEVANVTTTNKDELLKFRPEHPALTVRGARERSKKVTPQVSNFEFLDATTFCGHDIMKVNVRPGLELPCDVIRKDIVDTMEDHAKSALMLFAPFREKDDIVVGTSYLLASRQTHPTVEAEQRTFLDKFVQNVQDMRNASKLPKHSDELKKTTCCYKSVNSKKRKHDEMEEEDEGALLDEEFLTTMHGFDLEEEQGEDMEGRGSGRSKESHAEVSLMGLRAKGNNRLGFISKDISKTDGQTSEIHETSIEAEPTSGNRKKTNAGNASEPFADSNLFLFMLIGRQVSRKTAAEGKEVASTEATGAAESMSRWGAEKEFDEDQQRAFESMIASFVLTFHQDMEHHDSALPRESATSTRQTRLRLERLCHKTKQLVLFLDGPGGSGKSTVIKEVLRCGSQFCKNTQHPFNEMTILVTATSGAAATLVNGDTIHRSCFLDRAASLKEEQIEAFRQVRLTIVDKTSMAAEGLLVKLESTLRQPRQSYEDEHPHGGFNVAFCGDFRQLAPIGQPTTCNDDALRQWNECVTSHAELKGMCRFKDDPEWGRVLNRFCNGSPSPGDFALIDRRVVVNGMTRDGDMIPPNVQRAAHANRDRCAVNAALFGELVTRKPEKAPLVFSDDIEMFGANEKKHKLRNEEKFWTECSARMM